MIWTALALSLLAPPVQAGAPKPVKVDAKCPTGNRGKFSLTVDPWQAIVVPGQGIEWSLTTNNNKNQDIEISAKDPDHWLYVNTTVKGKNKVLMTTMVDETPGATYDYDITVYCEGYDPIVLDPRIKVEGG